MTSFFRFFSERHLFATILTIMIILLGIAMLPSIKRDTFPDAELDEVVINTRYNDASPNDIELKITNPIEDELKSIDGIKEYTSISVENTSLIRLVIDPDHKDKDKVRDTIREKITGITTFPNDLNEMPSIQEIESTAFPILDIGMYSNTLNYPQLRNIAKAFKSDLENMKGIRKLYTYGYKDTEFKIQPNPDALAQFQVSLMQLIQTIQNQNIRASMGTLKQDNEEFTLVNDSRLLTISDIEQAIIRSNFNGNTVRMEDVATIMEGYEDSSIHSRILGKDGITFNVVKSDSADIIFLTKKIDLLIEGYKTQFPDIAFVKASDTSKYLKNRLKVMISNGLIGLTLVFLVLSFFLNKRMAFWVSLGIPVSVCGVFFLMPVFNMTINIISLLALIIVIGIIVDDGIIVAENIAKYREQGLPPVDASVKGIQTVFKPVITTIFTTIVAFSPMFFMSGVMGKFIYQIPLVITIALLISLVEVVIALPSHLATGKTFKNPIKGRHIWVQQARTKYQALLKLLLRRKYTLVIGFIGTFFLCMVFAATFMNFVLFPESSAVSFLIRVEAPNGTPLATTNQRIAPIEQAILKLPDTELQAFVTQVGMTGDSYMLMEQDNLGIIRVDLIPFSGRERSARDIMQQIKTETENTPGFNKITYQVEAGGPPVGKAINIRVIHPDDTKRNAIATKLYDYVQNLNGAVSIERNDKLQKSQLNIDIDQTKLGRLGLTTGQIHKTIRTAFSGSRASSIRHGNETLYFNVELNKKDKSSLSTLQNLTIPNATNRLIKLKDVASFNKMPGSPNYYHFNGDRSTTISGDINKKMITSTQVTNKVKKVFNSTTYPGVRFEFGGESEETNRSVQDLIRSFSLALVGILFLLIILFNSIMQPIIVILTIPFGLIGVIIAFALHGQDLGFISMVGTIGLIGVVVNDSLVLVNHLNTTLTESNKATLLERVVDGSGDRFRPILITSCTTIAGLLPLAYGLGGSDPFIAPMALAIGYGLLFSTPLTLVLLPALYMILIDIHTKFPKIGKVLLPNITNIIDATHNYQAPKVSKTSKTT
jgi:multidrug efflux pump subunit AcrB